MLGYGSSVETVHGDSLACTFEVNQVRIKLLFSVPRLENKPDDRTEIVELWQDGILPGWG